MKVVSAKAISILFQIAFLFIGFTLIKGNASVLFLFLLVSSVFNYSLIHVVIKQFRNTTKNTFNINKCAFKEVSRFQNNLKAKVDEANIDHLTQTYNRKAFENDLLELEEDYLSILMIDLVHFKKINDTYGHLEGDRILKEAGELLSETVKGKGTVYRYGGEEFVVVTK